MILSDTEIALLSTAGSLAPSGGNAQPWLVDIDRNIFKICLDPKFLRIAPYTYITGGIFSLGMFCENICIASNALGLEYTLTISDAKEPEDFRVIFEYTQRNAAATPSSDSLMPFLSRRVSNRKLHQGGTIASESIKNLESSFIGVDTPCLLTLIAEEQSKKKVVEYLAESEAIRMKNTGLFSAMLDEIRWNNQQAEQTKDGIDVATLELSKADLLPLRIINKYPFFTKILPNAVFKPLVRKYMLSSSHIGCITITEDITYKNLFMAGRASQKLWLLATKLDIALHPWTSFPFMNLEANHSGCLNKQEQLKIKYLYGDLQKNIYNNANRFPIFIFRLFKSDAPSARALRRDWKSYTCVHSNEPQNKTIKTTDCQLDMC